MLATDRAAIPAEPRRASQPPASRASRRPRDEPRNRQRSRPIHGMRTLALLLLAASSAAAQSRARDLGVAPGIFTPGAYNAITDVACVKVGHATVIVGDSIH